MGQEEKIYIPFLPVCQDIRVRGLPCKRPKLHNCNKTAQIVNFLVLIFSMYHSRKEEQLGTLNIKKNNNDKIKFQLNSCQYCTKIKASNQEAVLNHHCAMLPEHCWLLSGLILLGLNWGIQFPSSQAVKSVWSTGIEGGKAPGPRKSSVANGAQWCEGERGIVVSSTTALVLESGQILYKLY